MIYTLVVYDRAAGVLVQPAQPFVEHRQALQERFRLERSYGDTSGNIEIVVLASRTQKDLLRTHSRYFRSLNELTARSVLLCRSPGDWLNKADSPEAWVDKRITCGEVPVRAPFD